MEDQAAANQQQQQQQEQTGSQNKEEKKEESQDKVTTLESIIQEKKICFDLVKDKKFEEAEMLFGHLMQRVIAYYNDELAFPLAQFYYDYGSLILQGVEVGVDLFGDKFHNVVKEQKSESDSDSDGQVDEDNNNINQQENPSAQACNPQQDTQNHKKVEEEEKNIVYKGEDVQITDITNKCTNVAENKSTNNNKNQMMTDEEIQQQQQQQQQSHVNQTDNDQVDDMQLAWENLEIAKKITLKKLEQLKQEEVKKEIEIKNVSQFLSDIYIRVGDFYCWQDSINEALKEYQAAYQISKEIEDLQYSRSLSEIYFIIANTLLYEQNSNIEDAIRMYINSIQILENILCRDLQLPHKQMPDYKQIQLQHLSKDHLKESFLDTEQTKDLKSIICNVYDKLEDSILQRNEQEKLKQMQSEMKKQAQNSDSFAQPQLPQSNGDAKLIVKNLGTVGNAIIKRKLPPQQPEIPSPSNIQQQTSQNQQSSMDKIKEDSSIDNVGHVDKKMKMD